MPVDVDALVLIVKVDDPWPVTELGLNVAVAFVGNPRTRNDTVPLKPLIAATVTVYVVLLPRVTVSVAGDAEMENEFTTKATVVECVRLPLDPVTVRV